MQLRQDFLSNKKIMCVHTSCVYIHRTHTMHVHTTCSTKMGFRHTPARERDADEMQLGEDGLGLNISSLSLELSDTKVYEPETRALPGTASHFCEALVLKLGHSHSQGTC